jgi:hypothetical protein
MKELATFKPPVELEKAGVGRIRIAGDPGGSQANEVSRLSQSM